MNEFWPLPQGCQNPIFQLRLRIFQVVRLPENAVVMANITVKFIFCDAMIAIRGEIAKVEYGAWPPAYSREEAPIRCPA